MTLRLGNGHRSTEVDMNFKINIEPPTVTAQEKGLSTRWDKVRKKYVPCVYEKKEVTRAKQIFLWYLHQNRPNEPLKGAIFLKTVWTFKPRGDHKPGEYKTTKPDTENSLKLFKDCMTKAGFWKDDAQVCYEVTVKQWGEEPGIEVTCSEIGGKE